jgi:hypothetical protein
LAAALGAGVCANAAAAQTQAPASSACVGIPNAAERFRCYESTPKLDFASLVVRELECDSPPRAADIIRYLIRQNAVSSLAFHMADGINYFALPRPEKIDGITAVAVFAHDETGRFPFMRSRGRSPGAVFGIVTRDATPAVDAWRLTHSPALLVDQSASSMQDATDIGCFWFPRPDPAVTAAPSAAPQSAPTLEKTGEDDLFEAGLAPKRQ